MVATVSVVKTRHHAQHANAARIWWESRLPMPSPAQGEAGLLQQLLEYPFCLFVPSSLGILMKSTWQTNREITIKKERHSRPDD